MKIFVGRKLLSEQPRAAHRPIFFYDQTAIRFVTKQSLANTKDDQRIETAAHNGQHQRCHERAAKFSEERFHKEYSVSSAQYSDLDRDHSIKLCAAPL